MKKTRSILRFGEISWSDLLYHLLRNLWVALLIALAAALTAWGTVGPSYPDSYSGSLVLSVRSMEASGSWNEQLAMTESYALKLNKAINGGAVNTDFASEMLNRKINVTVRSEMMGSGDQNTAATNLLTVEATASTQDEVYLYLVALEQNLSQLVSGVDYKNITLSAVNEPTVPSAEPSYSSALLLSLISAVAAGGLSCLIILALRIGECVLSTRKAAERLCVLPIAGALNKGGRGKGIDALLPLPTLERADGRYVQNLADTASFLLAQKVARLQVVPIDSKPEHREEADRLALNLALAMAEKGFRICFVDPTGAALSALSSEKRDGTAFYTVKGSKLSICTASIERAASEGFDKVVYASAEPDVGADVHTLWVFRAGCHTAEQVNAITAPGGGTPTSASLLCYGLHTVADTAAHTNEKAVEEMNEIAFSEDDEIDILRWAAATIKAMGRIKYKWMISFAIVTVVALAAGFLSQNMTHRMTTDFAVATYDVTAVLSDDQLAQMNAETAIELMEQGSGEFVYGNALYPSSRVTDRHQLADKLPLVLNNRTVIDEIERCLGEPLPAESVRVSNRSTDGSFTLSVVGNDQEKLAEVTEAFFAVAPTFSEQMAGGLTYFTGESSTSSDGTSVWLILILLWVLVIGVGGVYALIVGFRDRTAILRYEAEEALSTRVIDRLSLTRGTQTAASKASSESAEVGLARFIYEWAEGEKSGAVLMMTSALREEGTAQLTRTVEALLKQNGKRVAIADQAVCTRLLTEGREALAELLQNHDVVLIDRPGMAVDSDVAVIAKVADALLWAIRVGYADKERLEAASSVCPNEKVLGCVRMIG